MSKTPMSSRLTSQRRRPGSARARLQLEFSASSRQRSETPHLSAKSEPDASSHLELSFEAVSSAIAAEAVAGALAGRGERSEQAAEFEDRLSRAFDVDLAGWLGEVERSRPGKYVPLVRMLKQWRNESAHSRGLLFEHVLETVLNPLTWRAVHEDVGPRPHVSVLLFLPGSYARATKAEPLRDIDIAVVYRGAERPAEGIEDLTDAMTPTFALPTPPVVLQARRNAEARAALLSEFGGLTATEVAELAASEAKNTSALAGRWRREGRVIAVEHQGTLYYPAFQFDPDGKPRPIVREVLMHLRGPDTTPWQQALWFTTANGWLDGRRPVELLDERPRAVVAAAREALREPVG